MPISAADFMRAAKVRVRPRQAEGFMPFPGHRSVREVNACRQAFRPDEFGLENG